MEEVLGEDLHIPANATLLYIFLPSSQSKPPCIHLLITCCCCTYPVAERLSMLYASCFFLFLLRILMVAVGGFDSIPFASHGRPASAINAGGSGATVAAQAHTLGIASLISRPTPLPPLVEPQPQAAPILNAAPHLLGLTNPLPPARLPVDLPSPCAAQCLLTIFIHPFQSGQPDL